MEKILSMKCSTIFYAILITLVSLSACNTSAQQLTLADNGQSMYKIVLPAEASKQEQKCAGMLQNYIERVSGAKLPIVKEEKRLNAPGIYIGQTWKGEEISPKKKMQPESSLLQADGKDLVICGGSGKGLTYGVYSFIENYLHCKKISNDPAIVSTTKTIDIPGKLHEEHKPLFIYREVYYPAAHDAEYMEWNQLQSLEDLWGLWGHSYNKLVPAQTYFKTHPEYYALVKGKRQATQLCLSNEDVYKIVASDLKKRMADNPDALYWSISPNDDNGWCTCDKCSAVDREQGSPAGSLIKFVNRVANAFPDQQFTTLAYGYTHKAPKMKPAKNVFVFLSDIDAYRDKPLSAEGSAGAFRNDLKAWGALTPNLFVWDYVTEFTNYLAPFPNFHTLQPNMQYLKENGIKGMFIQGSGDTYGEWAELRSYVLAKLLQNDKADVKKLTAEFLKAYYGNAAKYMQQYLDMVQDKMIASKRKLDIYGNPINEWKSYLSPELLDQYSNIFDQAEGAAEENAVYAERLMRARLPLEYTVLQQARFYGIEKFGCFVKDNSGKWIVKPKFAEKVAAFVANCKKAKVTELSEGGLSPDKYMEEWNAIFKAGVTPTKAIGATVTLQQPFAEDYPAKGNRTLVDGNPGYNDFSYNWLCFYGVPMVATIDLGKAQNVSKVKMHFLDDPRHWIFLPENITVEVSADGNKYTSIANIKAGAGEEHYELSVKEYNAQYRTTQASPVRYIRVTASNTGTLPEWRNRDGKKAMIACDEVYVQ